MMDFSEKCPFSLRPKKIVWSAADWSGFFAPGTWSPFWARGKISTQIFVQSQLCKIWSSMVCQQKLQIICMWPGMWEASLSFFGSSLCPRGRLQVTSAASTAVIHPSAHPKASKCLLSQHQPPWPCCKIGRTLPPLPPTQCLSPG